MAGGTPVQNNYSATPGTEEYAQNIAFDQGNQTASDVPAMGMGGGLYGNDQDLLALYGGSPEQQLGGALSNINLGDYNG